MNKKKLSRDLRQLKENVSVSAKILEKINVAMTKCLADDSFYFRNSCELEIACTQHSYYNYTLYQHLSYFSFNNGW
jgi:hypothetical protein